MSATTTIITATYNKSEFLPSSAESILNQTAHDWLWWIVLDQADEKTTEIAYSLAKTDDRVKIFVETFPYARTRFYRPAVICNKYFPMVMTKYFCWHSDDDLKINDFIEVFTNALENNPEYHVVFGTAKVLKQSADRWDFVRMLPESPSQFGPVSKQRPWCRIDGGQILQTRYSWKKIRWKFPTVYKIPNQCDGLYMNALAKRFNFLFIDKLVQINRQTYLSESTKGVN